MNDAFLMISLVAVVAVVGLIAQGVQIPEPSSLGHAIILPGEYTKDAIFTIYDPASKSNQPVFKYDRDEFEALLQNSEARRISGIASVEDELRRYDLYHQLKNFDGRKALLEESNMHISKDFNVLYIFDPNQGRNMRAVDMTEKYFLELLKNPQIRKLSGLKLTADEIADLQEI